MSIEKEVNIRLKVHGGREGKAFAEMAKDAKSLEQNSRRAGTAVADMVKEMARSRDAGREIDRITKQLRTMGVAANEARAAATQLVRQVGEGARVSEQHVRRLATGMKSLGQQGGGWGARLGLTNGGLGGMGLATLGPTALAGAGIMALGRGASEGMRTSADEQIRRNISGGFDRFVTSVHEGLPIFQQVRDLLTWNARSGAAQSQESLQRQQERTFQLRQRQDLEERTRLERERLTRQGAEGAFGVEGEARLVRARGRAQVEDLQRGRRLEGLQDEAREIARGGRMEGRGLGILREETERTERRLRPEDTAALNIAQERGRLEQEARAARDRARGLAGEANMEQHRGQMNGPGTQGMNEALRSEVEIRQRLVQLEREGLAVQQQRSEAVRAEMTQLRDQARSQEEMYRQIAESERDRTRGLRERFGLMDEMQRRELLDVSRAIQGGQTLNQDQEEFVLRNREFFGNRAEQIAGGRAEAGGWGELMRNLNTEARQHEAEQRQAEAREIRVDLEQRIEAEINVSAETIAQDLAEQLLPKIQELTEALIEQMERRLGDAYNQAVMDRYQQQIQNN